MDSLRAKYPQDVAVLFRHFPLPMHPYARPAALAAVCAAAQGRFETFYDALYNLQDSLGHMPWLRYAVRAGVPDTAAFATCVADSAGVARLTDDQAAGNKLQVEGTPTVLVNGRR